MMSVTSRHPPAPMIAVVSRYGVARASTKPTTQSTMPSAARSPFRNLIGVRLARLAATHARDKLEVPASRFVLAALARRLFGFHPHPGASDSAVWPRQTQWPPRGVDQWLSW